MLTLRPNKAFVQDINPLLHKFNCKKDRDKFMQEYYGKMYALWKEYFQPCQDHKVAFLMLIKLPERLIILSKDGSEVSQVTSEDGVRQQFIHSNSIIFFMTGRFYCFLCQFNIVLVLLTFDNNSVIGLSNLPGLMTSLMRVQKFSTLE